MINMEEIQEEIEKLENCNCTSWQVCNKLATLYIVRAYYQGGKESTEMRSMSQPPMMSSMK